MSNDITQDSFDRAQRQYDNQQPPDDNTVVCEDCEGEGRIHLSNCCDAEMDMDREMCMKCHEHCEDYECDTCKGAGEIEKVPNTPDPDDDRVGWEGHDDE